MKKWIILLVVVAAIGGVWYYLSNYAKPFVPDIYKPKYGMVSRGDIRVPITAAGLVEPNQRIEVKSKASGEVIDRPVEAGKFVHKGDVLLVLKKDDEQRRYDGAKAELDRANALLAQAKVSVERARANIIGAQAEVERLTAQCKSSEFELNKVREADEGTYSEQELLDIQVQHEINLALKKAAEARASGPQFAGRGSTERESP